MKAIFLFELKSFLSNRLALFWTVAYPIAMLALMIALFDRGETPAVFYEGYRFRTAVGLVTLTIVASALFGMGQAISDLRAKRALLPYTLLPVSAPQVIFAILMSRIAVIFAFSVLFLIGSFWWLGVAIQPSALIIVQIIVSIIIAAIFSFSLVLPLLAISRNTTTIIALANIVNIYALMSASVFIPVEILPAWSEIFITSSPFYYLNLSLRSAFYQDFGVIMWGLNALLLAAAIVIIKFVSTRRLLIPK